MRLFSIFLLSLLCTIVFSTCNSKTAVDRDKIKEDVTAVIYDQMQAWNHGDIAGYMSGYDRTDSLRFASGGSISYGWQTTLERYQRRYPDQPAMGVLKFSDIDIKVISDDAALVFGKWQLQKAEENPWGLFTLLFRKTKDGWRIVHDHTSSAER